jgi:hypothetical protein
LAIDLETDALPIYTRDDLPELLARLKQIESRVCGFAA